MASWENVEITGGNGDTRAYRVGGMGDVVKRMEVENRGEGMCSRGGRLGMREGCGEGEG